jgi:hypothetical protein
MLKDRLADDLKAAMRSKDAVRLRTIRSLRAALMEKEIDLREGGSATLTDEQELAVVQKQAKQRRDSILQYEEAGRQDLSVKEQAELAVIEAYLPDQLSEEEVRDAVRQIVEEIGAGSKGDIGRVMGTAMGKLRGRAEGRMVQRIAMEILS